MPPAVAAPQADPNADAANQQGGQQRRRGGFLQAVIRMALMWYMMKQFSGSRTKPGDAQQPKSALAPLLTPGSLVDVHVFVSQHDDWKVAASVSGEGEGPVWVASDVPLARVESAIKKTFYYHPSEWVKKNGSVYVHAVFTPPGASPNPKDPNDFDGILSWGRTNALNVYLPKRKAGQGVNLLSGKNSTDDQPLPDDTTISNETVIISYLKPNVTISFVDEYRTFQSNNVPAPFAPFLDSVGAQGGAYYPMVWFNDFWLLRDYLVPVNETLDTIPIHISIENIGSLKYSVFSQMELSFSLQQSWGMSSSSETDEIKRIFLEGNPYFLGLTILVSLLHSLFDILAFKNDIGFWKDNKSMRGLSARTIVINAVCQLIIFLYLLDNETSFVVLMSSGAGTAIEFWKVTKAMDVKLDMSGGGFPRLRFKDRESYTSSKTDQYDAEAMRYLAYALYPLIGGYAVYSLMYQTHKSWYSWILNSLVGAVYTFGFILMCPQLYLNYKLKSVAHLPWRQMTYKFLNTIIDDLFAFVIKMPLLHRLSVFRDDLVFLVYLYQRWIYRVDKTRANEFGYAEEEAEEKEQTAAAEKEDKGVGGGETETEKEIETKKDK